MAIVMYGGKYYYYYIGVLKPVYLVNKKSFKMTDIQDTI